MSESDIEARIESIVGGGEGGAGAGEPAGRAKLGNGEEMPTNVTLGETERGNKGREVIGIIIITRRRGAPREDGTFDHISNSRGHNPRSRLQLSKTVA